jgi:hypothetical protein
MFVFVSLCNWNKWCVFNDRVTFEARVILKKIYSRTKMLILSFFDTTNTLFFVTSFIQRKIATCSSSFHRSSDDLLGDRAVPTKFNS